MDVVYNTAVRHALDEGDAVVALESTIITHGMPYPQNLAMAKSVEAVVTTNGAVPATIAVIEGALHIGLDEEQTAKLAATKNAMKLSRADLAYAMAQGKTGGTTVAATMMAAHLARIAVFATGGIGGVHQGAEKSFDISADLDELARTPVCVVCAGPKAILDIPKTLEALETRGVPLIATGQDEVPAFWSRNSGLHAPLRMDDPADIAALIDARAQIPKLDHGGVLVVNPVPEHAEIPSEEMTAIIAQAQAEAAENGIAGKDVTPWLLGRIFEITDGKSLKTNIALVENNAKFAAQIAVALAKDRKAPRIGFI